MKKNKKLNTNKREIAIYQSKNGNVSLEVNLRKDTIWLMQSQIALLFNTERSVITKHLSNIFKNGELSEKSNVQKMHIANSNKPVKFYNLDIIISVGYRVNSISATQFRIWATKILKQHILQGYTINQERLLQTQEKFRELQNAIALLEKKSQKKALQGQEKEILSLLSDYAKTFSILEQYDKGALKDVKGKKAKFILEYQHCLKIIFKVREQLMIKQEASDFFGNEIDKKFESIIKNLYQTFDSKELYPSINERAAHLLYLIIKDHPFVDGNKRSASFLFVYFLNKNNHLYNKTGKKKISDNALTSLALLIAESDPKEKDVLIKIIINFLSE